MDFVKFTTKDYPELLDGNIGCSVPLMWGDVVKQALDQMEVIRAAGADLRVAQIKEKFGALRIYTRGKHWREADYIIQEAERLTSHICVVCGSRDDVKIGVLEGGMWWMTLCKDHRYVPTAEDIADNG